MEELAVALEPFTCVTVDMPRHSMAASRPSWSEIPEAPGLVPSTPRPIVARDPERSSSPVANDQASERANDDPTDKRARPRPKHTLVSGPFARFRVPTAKSAFLLGVGVLVLPMLTAAALSHDEAKGARHVLTEGLESPHYALGESPALPAVRVKSTESANETRANLHRDRVPVHVVAAPVPPAARVRTPPPPPPNENPLYL
jgi:hypothetical protein